MNPALMSALIASGYRGITREGWRAGWRQQRMDAREVAKASFDSILYGRGFVEIRPDGTCEHIPLERIWR